MPWEITGNSGTSGTQHFLGTTDAQTFSIRVNGKRALRFEAATTPNLIGGFESNQAGPGVVGATIGGGGANGSLNRVEASFGTVGGGLDNRTSGERATVGGGASNHAAGISSTVPGGEGNSTGGDYTFAAGRRAKANHAGTFVWSDARDADFVSTADNQFLIQAGGGVGIGTNQPTAALEVAGDLRVATVIMANEMIEAGTSLQLKYQPAGSYLSTFGGTISGSLSVESLRTPSTVLSSGLWLFDANQQTISTFASGSNGSGWLAANFPNGNQAVLATGSSNNSTGFFAVYNNANQQVLQISSSLWVFNSAERSVATIASSGDSGFIQTNIHNGNAAVRLTTAGTSGYLDVFNNAGRAVAAISANGADAGFIETSMPNGNPAVRLTSSAGAGYLAIYDDAGNARHIFNGASATKHFVMPHPQDASKDIIYAAIEGPEAAAYWRGTATLQNGQAEVVFPEHFGLVANPDTVTVVLTPRSSDSKGLAITAQSESGFHVTELGNGDGAYPFDYFVAGVRRGLEGYMPVVSKGASAFAQEMPTAQPPNILPDAGGALPPPITPQQPQSLNGADMELAVKIHRQPGET